MTVPSWVLKAAAQSGLSLLPKNHVWNYLLQKHVTKSLDLNPEWFERKLAQSRMHIENYLAARPARWAPRSVFEIGTGWYPVLPLALYVCGAARIWTIDKFPWLRLDAVRATIRLFVEYAASGRLSQTLPWAREERLADLLQVLEDPQLRSAASMLERLKIYAWADDGGETGLPASSIDFLVSIGVLQYIPDGPLERIFVELRRIASPHAVMSHHISLDDDYAIFDPCITPYNFLQYPRSTWRLFNSSLNYQNRLRLSDYRRIHQSAGFKIVWEDNEKGSPADLDRVRLAKEFQCYPREELLVLRTWITSVPAVQPTSRPATLGCVLPPAPSR